MPLYEHVLLARQDVTAQQVETMIDAYKGVIEQNGGRLEKIEMWGVKSLAYRIKKNRKAHFALLNIDAPPAAIAEMERQMQISEDVLRFMTVQIAERPPGPTGGADGPEAGADPLAPLRAELDDCSADILRTLRALNDDLEARA